MHKLVFDSIYAKPQQLLYSHYQYKFSDITSCVTDLMQKKNELMSNWQKSSGLLCNSDINEIMAKSNSDKSKKALPRRKQSRMIFKSKSMN
ncbi:MAG: hypothetical protein CM15mP32_4210 [Flavobacteriaceae bacterium]|nr:MAG: hypothetical protein CM15mP32_4210 [Flavobacteriaceae bacterium]